jgi:hypothetical protein
VRGGEENGSNNHTLKAVAAMVYWCVKAMSFKSRHKKIYVAWVVISAFVALSMVLFLVAPFFLY